MQGVANDLDLLRFVLQNWLKLKGYSQVRTQGSNRNNFHLRHLASHSQLHFERYNFQVLLDPLPNTLERYSSDHNLNA